MMNGKELSEINNITLNGVVYEIHREYSGEKTPLSIVRDRLFESKLQNLPLTHRVFSLYNIDSGVGMSKEAK